MMKKTIFRPTQMTRTLAFAFAIAAASTLAATTARADVLEQKWQAGQQLSYDLKMDGTLRFAAPEDVPMIGGLPLEILLKGEGQSTLDTRDVDEFGVALVVPKLEQLQLKFNETNFNQSGVMGLRGGKATLSMNGQAVGAPMDWSKAANPDYGLRISKSLRVLSAQSLKTPEEIAAELAAKNDAKPAAKNAMPFDVPAMMQAMITRVMPPLLPTKDVMLGDTWTTNIQWPVLPNAAAVKDEKQAPLGKFDFKALAEEEIAGRKTWRIAVNGVVKFVDLSTRMPAVGGENGANENAKNEAAKNSKLPKYLSMTQKMKGDMWFDAAAGQIVKVDVHLDTTGEGRNVLGKPADGDMSYSGSFMMNLRKTSFAGNQPEMQE